MARPAQDDTFASMIDENAADVANRTQAPPPKTAAGAQPSDKQAKSPPSSANKAPDADKAAGDAASKDKTPDAAAGTTAKGDDPTGSKTDGQTGKKSVEAGIIADAAQAKGNSGARATGARSTATRRDYDPDRRQGRRENCGAGRRRRGRKIERRNQTRQTAWRQLQDQ